MDSEALPSSSSVQEDILVQKLLARGVPIKYLEDKQLGVAQFVNKHNEMLQDVVGALFPGVEEAKLDGLGEAKRLWLEFKQGHREGIKWVQWLVFNGNPEENLKRIQQEIGQVRGVCGAVWGLDDIAYRCRTCENDPTCAICVACFEAGNHLGHDYSMIHTGGGCCDCGDITAWKEAGFCSNHRGPGQAPPLPPKLVSTFKPTVEALLVEWANRLKAASKVFTKRAKNWITQLPEERVATQTSSSFVELLLNFCNSSESLLNFIGSLMASEEIGLLDLLLKSEYFLPVKVLNMLHELLFKLMADPNFKYQFAKVFILHYPSFIFDSLKEETEPRSRGRSRENPTSNFSVQIFTVSTLTLQLVVDLRLLDMLLEVLKDVLLSCAGDDGRLLVSKGPVTSNSYYRIVDDIRFVLRHPEVAQYVARERMDLYKCWLHLLAYIQGMDSQRRQTNIHVEEETQTWFTAYLVESQIANIHPLLIEGARKTTCMQVADEKVSHLWTDISCRENPDDEDIDHGHAKIGRISKDSDVSGKVVSDVSGKVETGGPCRMESSRGVTVDFCKAGADSLQTSSAPSALLWLIAECAMMLEVWLLLDSYSAVMLDSVTDAIQHRSPAVRGRGRGFIREARRPVFNRFSEAPNVEVNAVQGPTFIEWLRSNRNAGIKPEQEGAGQSVSGWNRFQEWKGDSRIWLSESGFPDSNARFGFVWNDKEWLEIDYDVSHQDISIHIPLHRFLALALQKTTEACLNVDQQECMSRSWHANVHSVMDHGFLQHLLPPHYQVPSFASLLMEHPLRIQVFRAQYHAGMWRRNGHSVQALIDNYHSVRWCEESSDLDLYLLQCCAVMAPPDDFVNRIIARFGLLDYFSLFLLRPNEYETVLAQQMLSLVIQIVVERRFCGYTAAQSCRRELIKRLAISDATHSQLMKSLPPRLQENKQWEEALPAISTYSKPSGMQQGKFSLRDECWKELDLYHPRWNANELQSAEDRYFRSCKASALIKQLPKWKKSLSPFQDLSRIATCGRVHDILRSILFHAVFSEKMSESRAPEGVLITALHLLALGLDTCSLFSYDKSFDSRHSDVQSDSVMEPSAYEPPPLLSKATEKVQFGGIDSDGISNKQSLISLLVLLMKKYSPEALCVPRESHQCNVGVLIQGLLKTFADLHHGCMHDVESLAPQVLHRMLYAQDSLLKGQTSNVSEAERRKLLARERQAAIMKKMKAAQEKFASTIQSTQEVLSLEKGHPIDVCALCREFIAESPLCCLTFVQRSRLLGVAAEDIPSWESGHVKGNLESSVLNSETRGALEVRDSTSDETQIRAELLNLIQMALNGEVDQTGMLGVESLWEFLADEEHADASASRQLSLDPRISETSSSESGSDDLVEEEKPEGADDSASTDTTLQYLQPTNEEMASDEDGNNKVMQSSIVNVLIEYVSIVSRNRKEHLKAEAENSASATSEGPQRHIHSRTSGAGYQRILANFGADDNCGVHMSSCGHAVHKECVDLYLSSLMQRYQSRTLYEGLQIVDPEQGEFLCPMCRRLANSVLPYAPKGADIPSDTCQAESVAGTGSNYADHDMIDIPSESLVSAFMVNHITNAITLLHNAEELVRKVGYRKAVSKPLSKTMKAIFDDLFLRLCGLYFPNREVGTKSTYCRVSQSLLLWDVVRYTMMSTELASRTPKENRIYSLHKAVLNEPVLPSLIWAARISQSQNRQSVLLRSRGMQLLVGSICFGGSRDSLSEPLIPGSISRVILSRLDSGHEGADVQFWKRMADPVLAHDPFSSLVWTIFCLPSFPTTVEPFIALTHLFYLVCLIQVIVFMRESMLSNLSELLFSTPVRNFLQIVISNFSNTSVFLKRDGQAPQTSSGSLIVMMRRFTLSYLRCCALLKKFLFVPCLEETEEWGSIIDPAAKQKVMDEINPDNDQDIEDSVQDLKELEVLERELLIPSSQELLGSVDNQQLVLRWCQHFIKESGTRKLLPIPKPVMAVPFKIMDLPPLYQTLLQRYIKERCPKCSTVPEQPALCLLCGTLCCAFGRHGCCSTNGQSECYKHAMFCGGGVGVFLMIRKTNILLQRCARQASWPSPYLDEFGEEDIGMQRGKPLYLNQERYESLAAMVARHGLDHNSLVLSHTTREAIIWR